MSIDLEKDQELCDAATEGPWTVIEETYIDDRYGSERPLSCRIREARLIFYNDRWDECYPQGLSDIKFIASARTLLPEYIAEVKWLRAYINMRLGGLANMSAVSDPNRYLTYGDMEIERLRRLEDWQKRAVVYVLEFKRLLHSYPTIIGIGPDESMEEVKQLIEEAK